MTYRSPSETDTIRRDDKTVGHVRWHGIVKRAGRAPFRSSAFGWNIGACNTGALAALLLCMAIGIGPVAAAEIVSAEVGIADSFRVGHWTPVHLQVRSSEPRPACQLQLITADGDGQTVITSQSVQLESGTSSLRGLVRFGRVETSLEIRLLDADGRPLANRRIGPRELGPAITGSQQWLLQIGSDLGLEEALARHRDVRGEELIYRSVDSADQLPTHWLGYSGVQMVVLQLSSDGIAGQLTEEQIVSLRQWVSLGGNLILVGGESAERLLTANNAFASLLPGTFDSVQAERRTTGLESFVGATTRRLDSLIAENQLRFSLPVAVLREVDGRVEVSEGFGDTKVPVLVRGSIGLGHVAFVAFDLHRPPMSIWTDGRRQLWERLLGMTLYEDAVLNRDEDVSALSTTGFRDLLGQLRGSLDRFQGTRLVPFSWVALLIGGYILLMGPVDYFLLQRLGRRFGLTWLTLPIWVALGCGLAIWLTGMWKGDTRRQHRVDLLQIDADEQQVRGTSWSFLLSPKGSRFHLKADFDLPIDTYSSSRAGEGGNPVGANPIDEGTGRLVSWQGMPGEGFGGMNTPQTQSARPPYQQTCLWPSPTSGVARLEGLPIDAFSSRGLLGEFWTPVDLPIEHDLAADAAYQLTGSLTNPLNVDLRDCRLFYDRWVYPLPSVAPGGRLRVVGNSNVRTISALLTRSEVDEDFKDRSQPWSINNADTDRIMEMLLFHEAVGGTKYTSLLHRYRPQIDLSRHLTQNRAVLVGRIDKAVFDFGLDAETQQHTFICIVLPVKPFER